MKLARKFTLFFVATLFTVALVGLTAETADARKGVQGKARSSVSRPSRSASSRARAPKSRPTHKPRPTASQPKSRPKTSTAQTRPTKQGAKTRPVQQGTKTRPAQGKSDRMADRNANKNVNRDRDVNRNRDINIDRDIDVDVDHRGGWYDDHDHWHPVATGLAVGAAAAVGAAVIGSIVNSVPADCDTLVVNGTSYRHCNGTWYEPRYSGGDVTYIVVESPQ